MLLLLDSAGRVAESLVLGQRSYGAEGLTATLTFDLVSAVGVHAFVAAEVGELSVGFEADFALEGLDAGVDVGVLFEAR